MKKTILSGVLLLLGLLLSNSELFGQSVLFSDPIQIGSSPNQIDQRNTANKASKVDATHMKFFGHPTPPLGNKNYSTPGIQLNGRNFLVNDVVASPGLLPEETNTGPVELRDMLDDLGDFGALTLSPLHGFCPRPRVFSPALSRVETTSCQVVYTETRTSRQLHIADVRNAAPADEIERLFGVGYNPLVQSIIGNADERVGPYDPDLYPATLHRQSGHQWPLLNAPTPSYQEVIAYDVADIGVGLVTVAYDPIELRVRLQETVAPLIGTSTTTLGPVDDLQFFSPNIYFRKDDDGRIGRLRLAGYSHTPTQLHKVQPGTLQYLQALDLMALTHPGNLMFHNFNPIAVEAIDFPQNVPGLFTQGRKLDLIDDEGFAVVNQATLLDLDQMALWDGGPFVDPSDNQIHPWHYYLGIISPGAGGQQRLQVLDNTILPHRLITYVTFFGQFREWALRPEPNSRNPNSVFIPFALAPIGPGVMDADVAVDTAAGIVGRGGVRSLVSHHRVTLIDFEPLKTRKTLVVAPGEPARDGNYYLYKIDPFVSQKIEWRGTLEQRLQQIRAGLPLQQQAPVDTRMVLPETYRIEVPQGFGPYGIEAGDLNGDGCSDVLISFRGRETVAADQASRFDNFPGQNVVYQVSASDLTMHASVVLQYNGRRHPLGICVYDAAPSARYEIPTPPGEPKAQLAAMEIADFDSNGTKDVLIGDGVVRKVEGNDDFASHAYLFLDANPVEYKKIRVGFNSTKTQLDPRQVIVTGQGLAGVADLTADIQPMQGANIGAINGPTLTTAKMGCPSSQNFEVASPAALYMSIRHELVDTSTSPPTIMPQDCLKKQACFVPQNAPQNVAGLPLPFFENHPCCNPCDLDALPNNGNEWDDFNYCRVRLCGPQGSTQPAPHPTLCQFYGSPRSPTNPLACGAPPPMCTTPGLEMLPAGHVCCNPCSTDCEAYMARRASGGCAQPQQPSGGLCEEYNVILPVQETTCACTAPLEFLTRGHACCQDACSSDCISYTDSLRARCNGGDQAACNQLQAIQRQRPADRGEQCRPIVKLDEEFWKREQLFAEEDDDETAEGDERTEFASRYRPDQVYSTKTEWIADMRELQPAQAQQGGGLLAPQVQTQLGTAPINPQLPRPQFQTPRLPRGQVMPGDREMTVLVNMGKPQEWTCSPTGPLGPGDQCNNDHKNCREGEVCTINCQCHDQCGTGPLDPGEQCNRDYACQAGHVCDINCQCIAPQTTESKKPEELEPSSDCDCFVTGASTPANGKRIRSLNDEFRALTGRKSDIIAEPLFSVVKCLCCVPNAADPGQSPDDVSLSRSGDILPGLSGNIRPYMIVQTKGSVFSDFTKSQLPPTRFDTVQEPLRLFPAEASAISDGTKMLLPNLSSASPLANVVPMSASHNVVVQDNSQSQMTRLNNVIQHEVRAVAPGQTLSIDGKQYKLTGRPVVPVTDEFMISGFLQIPTAAMACHIISAQPVPDIGSWTGVEGRPETPVNIEDRLLNWDAVMLTITEGMQEAKQLGKPFSLRDVDLPWEENLSYKMVLVQGVYGEKGKELPAPQERTMTFVVGLPYSGGKGASCACNVNASSPDSKSLALLLFFILVGTVIYKTGRKAFSDTMTRNNQF